MVLSGALSKESPLPLSSNGSSSRLEVQDDEGESCNSLSVKFDLEKTTIHRHEVELEYDASNIWYNRAETRSFQISTLRSILACRQLMEEGRERDISEHHCVHGIEDLISSDSTRRSLVSSILIHLCVVKKCSRCVLCTFSLLG